MTYYSHRVNTDVFGLENVVQQTGVVASKNLIIDVLRNAFEGDRQFKYVADIFGFPLINSHLGLDPNVGYNDDDATRIFIGSSYRYDVKFNPSIIVKNTSSRYHPISFNQNVLNVSNKRQVLTDGYGNQTVVYIPDYHTQVGAWDQTIEVKVIAENEVDREELCDIVQVVLMGSRRLEMQKAGVFIKTMSTSGETETPYANDFLYSVAINLDVFTEWKMHIPITNLCERIGICMSFGTLDGVMPDALAVNDVLTVADLI